MYPRVRAACLHLTDFKSQGSVQIAVLSAKDLLTINPADIVTKLGPVFGVAIGVFGLMHALAAVCLARDRRAKRAVAHMALSSACGFRELPGGVWSWDFTATGDGGGAPAGASFYSAASEEKLGKPVAAQVIDNGAVKGPFVFAARLMGIPFARLRLSIPVSMIPGNLARDGLGTENGVSLPMAQILVRCARAPPPERRGEASLC